MNGPEYYITQGWWADDKPVTKRDILDIVNQLKLYAIKEGIEDKIDTPEWQLEVMQPLFAAVKRHNSALKS